MAAAAATKTDTRSWGVAEPTLAGMLKALPEGAHQHMAAPHIAKLFELARQFGIGPLRAGVDWDRNDNGELTSVRVLLEGRDLDGIVRSAIIELAEKPGVVQAIEVPLAGVAESSSASGLQGPGPCGSGLSEQGREQLIRQNGRGVYERAGSAAVAGGEG